MRPSTSSASASVALLFAGRSRRYRYTSSVSTTLPRKTKSERGGGAAVAADARARSVAARGASTCPQHSIRSTPRCSGLSFAGLSSTEVLRMKLYFSPGACSLSPHIVLREAGLKFELEQVDLKTKKTRSGVAFSTINPKDAVPALQLDDGEVLTEGAVIVQYIADQKPEAKLAPAAGTLERYRLQEWLNYIASELHKAFSPLFRSTTAEDAKQDIKEGLQGKFEYVNRQLEGKQFLLGDRFSAADAYLFTMMTWAKFTAVDLSRFPALTAYYQRIKERPAAPAAGDAPQKARAPPLPV